MSKYQETPGTHMSANQPTIILNHIPKPQRSSLLVSGFNPTVNVNSFVPEAVSYNEDQDLTRSSPLTSISDSKQLTFSLWVKPPQQGSSPSSFGGTIFKFSSPGESVFDINNLQSMRYRSFNGSGATNVDMSFDPSMIRDFWSHVIISFDLTDVNKRHVYIDDKPASVTYSVYENQTMVLTGSDWSIAPVPVFSSKFIGCISEFWLQGGLYIDLDVEANRRNFIDADGNPVDLTGYENPDIYLKSDAANAGNNSGAGGNFTINNGPLIDCDNQPPNQINVYTVIASTDDAEEFPDFGFVLLSSGVLEIPNSEFNVALGFRFQNIDIPQGATINSAKLDLISAESNSEASDLIIWGEDIDNAPTFTTATADISNRTSTTATVNWSVPSQTSGISQQTPDIKNILQEIIDRPGWASGNAVVIVIQSIDPLTGEREYRSFDGNPAQAALLKVSYVE